MSALYPHQERAIHAVYDGWRGSVQNQVIVSPTGSGKTRIVAEITQAFGAPVCTIAHRQELVAQISLAYARVGLPHRIIAPKEVQRTIAKIHADELDKVWINAASKTAVAGVDTLIRLPESDPIFRDVRLWTIDEAHHLLRSNKWGKAASRFGKALGLGATATPARADRKGLGRHASGLFDAMHIVAQPRDLIEAGFLCPYEIVIAECHIQRSNLGDVGVDGDYSLRKIQAEMARGDIVGDIVGEYLKWAAGKSGCTFLPDFEMCLKTKERFLSAGVPAEVISSRNTDAERASIMRRFRARELLQVINIDLLGEGTDVPVIEVVSLGRPTASLGLYIQQVGRGLRTSPGKPFGLIIDHVGNVIAHQLPDAPRVWTLDDQVTQRSRDDAIPLRRCENPICHRPYESHRIKCPHCGYAPEPAVRSSPEHVEGDMVLLDEDTKQKLFGDIRKVSDAPKYPPNAPYPIKAAIDKRHEVHKATQKTLRDYMAWWIGEQNAKGVSAREAQKLFYIRYDIDVWSAQALASAEMKVLAKRVWADLQISKNFLTPLPE